MAAFTLTGVPWPAGTEVSVYPAAAWVDTRSAPSGPVSATATVDSDGTLAFTALEDRASFVAYADGTGVRFVTAPEGLQAPVSRPDRERIKALEDQASGAGGAANVLLWDTGAGDYLPAELRSDTSQPREFVGPVDPDSLASVTGPVYGDRWTPTEEP